MPEEKYVVIAEFNGYESVMSVWSDLIHAALHADVLRQDGYENVTVKLFKEMS